MTTALLRSITFSITIAILTTLATTPAMAGDTVECQLGWEHQTNPDIPQAVVYDVQDRDYFYVANRSGGVLIFDASDISNPTLEKTITQAELFNLEPMNVFQQGDYLYVALGNFFGNDTQEPGMAIIDVSDPANASLAGIWKGDSIVKGSAYVMAEGNYAYLSAMNLGLYVFDVSNKANVVEVGHYIPDKNFPVMNPSDVQEPNCRGMAIDGDVLYMCYDAGGLRMIDVTDKANPFELSHYINQGALNKQQAYNNIALDGNYAYVAIDYCGMEVLDISNPANVTQVAWWNPWGCETTANNWFNSPGHTNQIEYVATDQLVFLSAGGSELIAVDVSTRANPKWIGQYGAAGNSLGVWGATVHGDHVFLSYINSLIPFVGLWSGVKIVEWNKMSMGTGNFDQTLNGIVSCTAYPNPFRDEVQIQLQLEEGFPLRLCIYDALGRQVRVLVDHRVSTGTHRFTWNGRDANGQPMSNGLYFFQVDNGQTTLTRKLMLAR